MTQVLRDVAEGVSKPRVPLRTQAYYGPLMGGWREIIGHDGYLTADLEWSTRVEGGSKHAVQSGYHAAWWLVDGEAERWLGSGPLDVVEALSIKPGATGPIKIYPLYPPDWVGVGPGAVLHLRERRVKTLGIAVVKERVDVPDDAPLRLDAIRLPPNAVLLVEQPPDWERPKGPVPPRGRRPFGLPRFGRG